MTAVCQTEALTFPNNAALARGTRVKLSSGYLAAAGINEDCIGVMEDATLAGDSVGAVRPISGKDSLWMIANGAVSQYAEVYEAADGKVSATVSGVRIGIAMEASTTDGDVVEILPFGASSGGGAVVAEERTFTEAGDTTYTGSVAVPAGATILDVVVHAVALWDDGTSAVMKVGDVADDDGIFTGVNLKATDLLAGESISLGYTGGKEGADVDGGETAGDHVRRRYLSTARVISGVVTTGGQDGTAGRTRMTVLYAMPNSVAATGA